MEPEKVYLVRCFKFYILTTFDRVISANFGACGYGNFPLRAPRLHLHDIFKPMDRVCRSIRRYLSKFHHSPRYIDYWPIAYCLKAVIFKVKTRILRTKTKNRIRGLAPYFPNAISLFDSVHLTLDSKNASIRLSLTA